MHQRQPVTTIGHVHKKSEERKEYENLSWNRRLSEKSMEQVKKTISAQIKQAGNTYNHQRRQLQEAETKRKERLANLKSQRASTLRQHSSSLPSIGEGWKSWSDDPYPITFPSFEALKLSDGKTMYQPRRRKSREFEDVEMTYFKSEAPPRRVRRPTPAYIASPLLLPLNQSSKPQIALKFADTQGKTLKSGNKSPTTPRESVGAKLSPPDHEQPIFITSDASPTKSPGEDNSEALKRIEIALSNIEKKLVASSPLSKRKVLSVLARSESFHGETTS